MVTVGIVSEKCSVKFCVMRILLADMLADKLDDVCVSLRAMK